MVDKQQTIKYIRTIKQTTNHLTQRGNSNEEEEDFQDTDDG